MASRHLRKLQKDDFVNIEDEVESPEARRDAKFNLFSLLNEGNDASEGEAERNSQEDEIKQHETIEQKQQSQSGKKKKKKKTKNPGAKDATSAEEKEEEDLDKLLKSMNIQLEELPERAQGQASTSAPTSVLLIISKRLKPQDELRRIFGSKIVSENAKDTDSGLNLAGASRKVRRLAQRGLIKHAQLKEGIIITPRYDWPKPDDALRMERDRDSQGQNCFRYVHTNAYKVAEAHFKQCQASYDPNQIIALIGRYPYHIGSLMAASDLYRSGGQHETADDMLSRAIYAMEMAWPPNFSLGECTLEYDLPENVPLFKALFQHIRSLTKRGLYTTALENAKAMYTLNPLDPYGILMVMDYIAIKAEAYQFIQDFASEIDPHGTGLLKLPGWAFSIPLATFLSQQGNKSASQKNQANSGRSAEDAILQFPDVICGLWERLQANGLHPDKEWREILGDSFLQSGVGPANAGYAHLIDIYLERHSTLFKNPQNLQWLKGACQNVLNNPGRIDSAFQKNASEWPATEENPWSHLRLAAYSDNEAALPQEELQANFGGAEAEGFDDLEDLGELEEDEEMAAMHLAATLDLPNGFLNLLNNALEDLDLEPDTRAHYQQLRDAPDTVQRVEALTQRWDAGDLGEDEAIIHVFAQILGARQRQRAE